jgi:hypothetical protein
MSLKIEPTAPNFHPKSSAVKFAGLFTNTATKVASFVKTVGLQNVGAMLVSAYIGVKHGITPCLLTSAAYIAYKIKNYLNTAPSSNIIFFKGMKAMEIASKACKLANNTAPKSLCKSMQVDRFILTTLIEQFY